MDVARFGMADERLDQFPQWRFLGIAEHEVAGVRAKAATFQDAPRKGSDDTLLLGNGEHPARYRGHGASSLRAVAGAPFRVAWACPGRGR